MWGEAINKMKKKKKSKKEKKGKGEAKEPSSSSAAKDSDPTVIKDAVTFVSVYGIGDVCLRPCQSTSITYQQYARHESFLLSKTPPNLTNLLLEPFHLHLHATKNKRVSLFSGSHYFLFLSHIYFYRIRIQRI